MRYIFIVATFLSVSQFTFSQSCDDCTEPGNLNFQFFLEDIELGDTLPVDFLICGFRDIISFQLPIAYNPSNMKYVKCDTQFLPNFACEDITVNSPGEIILLWLAEDFNNPVSLDDQDVMFTLFFEVTGIDAIPDSIKIVDGFGSFEFEFIKGNPDDASETSIFDFCQDGGEFFTECPNVTGFISGCGGQVDGSGSFEFSLCGGDAPFDYLVVSSVGENVGNGTIPDNLTPLKIDGLDPGKDYNLEVRDVNGVLITTENISIEVQDPMVVDIDISNSRLTGTGTVPCAEGPQSVTRIEALVSPPGNYLYEWNDDGFGQELSKVSPGDYSVTVTDLDTGCTATASYTLNRPDPLDIVIDTLVGPACDDTLALGSISISISGGLPEFNDTKGVYEVKFEDPISEISQTRASRPDGTIIYSLQNRAESGLLAGSEWNITVDDYSFRIGQNCPSESITFIVPEPSEGFTFSVSDTIVKCDGLADVTFSVSPPLPDPPPRQSDNLFIFDEDGNQLNLDDKRIVRSGDTVNDVPPGTYTFIYESLIDVCTGTGSFIVKEADPLTIEPSSLIPIQPGCGTGPLGTVDIVATGGTGLYSYTWSDDLQRRNESRRDDLMPGLEYFVTITDSGDCEVSSPSDEPILIIDSGALSISQDSIVSKGSDCAGNLGSIQLMTSPTDTNEYILDIVTQQVPGTIITDLPDGEYELTIRLSGNETCFDGPFMINVETGGSLALVDEDVEISPIACDGTLGSISLPPTTGVQGDYILKLTDGGPDTLVVTDNKILDIEAGLYELIVALERDPTCSLNFPNLEFEATVPLVIDEQNTVINQPSCSNGNRGSATIDITGGVSPLSFEWSDGVIIEDQTSRSDLMPGSSYLVTITDAAGCTFNFTDSLVFDDVVPLIESDRVIAQGPDCIGNVSFIRLDVSPSDTNVYILDIGSQQIEGTEIMDLDIGTYSLNVSLKNNPSCSSGPFELTLESSTDFSFDETLIERTLPDCNGNLASVFFPTADDDNLVFLIDGELQDNPIIDLEPETEYLVTVASGLNQNCNVIVPIAFEQPTETIITIQEDIGPSCGGDEDDGFIALNVTGNLDDLRFVWSDGFTDNFANRDSLGAGTYSVTVYNGTGCSDTINNIELVTNLNDVFPAIIVEEAASCRGAANGVIEFEDEFGFYTFVWDDTGEEADMRDDLVGDQEYTVTRTIQGTTGCSDKTRITISTKDRLIVDNALIVEVPPTCFGGQGSLTIPDEAVSNGQAPYTYNLMTIVEQEVIAVDDDITDGQGYLADIEAGSYLGFIRDSLGCEFNFPVELTDGPRIVLPNTPTKIDDPSCLGESDATYSLIASGGPVGLFDFVWSSGETEAGITESTATALSSGMQSVVISDGVCDPDTLFFNVDEGSSVGINPTGTTIQDVACFDENTGIITIDLIGASQDFTFDWEDFPTVNTNRLTELTQGSYSVTITDNNTGCDTDTLFIVESPEELRLDIDQFSTVDISCRNPSGVIAVNATGGTGDYELNWTDDVSNTFTAVDLSPGDYMITVADDNGCIDTVSYELIAEQPILFEVSEYEPIRCADLTTAVGIENIEGGVPPYRYSIIDGGQLFEDSMTVDVGAGSYTFNVFDADGCQAVNKITEDIEEPVRPMINIGQDTSIDLGETFRFIPDVIAEFGIDSINYMSDATLFPISDDGIAVQPDTDVSVIAQLVDMNGCTATDEIFIKVKKSRKVYIPNVIYKSSRSPVDGRNTLFSVYTGLGVSQVLSMQVFDRWGNIVYQELDPLPANNLGIGVGGWNGELNGSRIESGVYGYLVKVEFSDGQVLNYRGNVTVIN